MTVEERLGENKTFRKEKTVLQSEIRGNINFRKLRENESKKLEEIDI